MRERPVVAVVGASDAGKTLLLEELIRGLTRSGWRVGTVKHHHGSAPTDREGSDTFRHRRAGSTASVLLDAAGCTVFGPPEELPAVLRRLEGAFPELDFILLEGFKESDYPKIWVRRPGEESRELRGLVGVYGEPPPGYSGRHFRFPEEIIAWLLEVFGEGEG